MFPHAQTNMPQQNILNVTYTRTACSCINILHLLKILIDQSVLSDLKGETYTWGMDLEYNFFQPITVLLFTWVALKIGFYWLIEIFVLSNDNNQDAPGKYIII